MREALTNEDLRSFISEAREYVVQLLFAIGRAVEKDKGFNSAPIADGINQYTIAFRWYIGHGGSINVVAHLHPGQTTTSRSIDIPGSIVNGWGSSMGRDEFRVLRMCDRDRYGLGAELQVVSAIESFISALLPSAQWKNHYGICQSSFHKTPIYSGDLLYEWAGKQLCEDCAKVLSLTEDIYHRTGESEPERNERDKMTPRLRWEILERDHFTCKACGRSAPDVKLHVDHKIPIAMGGKTVTENLHTLCAACNLGKSAKMPSQATMEFWEQVTV